MSNLNTYVVAFDEPDVSRRKVLAERFKGFHSYCPIHNNCWAIMTDMPIDKTAQFLLDVLSSGGFIFVVHPASGDSAWKTYSDKHTKWLQENL